MNFKNKRLNIIAFTKQFRRERKLKRKFAASFPDIEFECKIPLKVNNLKIITKSILKNIKSSKFILDDVVLREEFHHFYGNSMNMGAFIFMLGSEEVWIKRKSDINTIRSPKHNIPILVRKEKKLKPKDLLYQKIFQETLKLDYIGSFKKSCVDISFWFNNFLFTVTVARANNNQSDFCQIEIEYDGHNIRCSAPSKKNLPVLFDEVVSLLLPKSEMSFSIKTKMQWLKSDKK